MNVKSKSKILSQRPVTAAGRRFEVHADFEPAGDQPAAIDALVEGAQQAGSQILLGVTGSGKTYTIAKVVERLQCPTLVMAPNKTLAAQLYGEYREFFPRNSVEYFVSYYDYYQPEAYVPSSDVYIEKDASVNEHIEQMRLSATKALLEKRDVLIVATVSAIYGLGDPDTYLQMMLHLSRGEEVRREDILRRLAELQYSRNEFDLRRGSFRVRGDVIDVFPAESGTTAVRLSLFDTELEKIELFDPLTGAIERSLPRTTIYPKSHYATPKERLQKAVDKIETELKEHYRELQQQGKLLEAQRLQQRTRFDVEMIRELGYCTGIENYSRYLSGRLAGEPPPTLFDYLPEDALVVVDESHVTVPQINGMFRGDRSRKETLVEYGFRLPSALDNRPLRFEEWEKYANRRLICTSATPGIWERERASQTVELLVRPTGLIDPAVEIRPVATQVDNLQSEILVRSQRNERVLVTTLTKRMSEDLTEYLTEHGTRVRYLHSDIDTVERMEILRDLRLGNFDVLVGINLLREGLDLPEVSLVAIFDADREGFLRSENSLIQTIGRAARNVNGMAILYADNITGSIRRAMDETNRRRQRQIEYNQQHGIVPVGITKGIRDIMEAGRDQQPSGSRRKKSGSAQRRGHTELNDALFSLNPEQLGKEIRLLEKRMFEHASNLEFEQAAAMRDRLEMLRSEMFQSSDRS